MSPLLRASLNKPQKIIIRMMMMMMIIIIRRRRRYARYLGTVLCQILQEYKI
jgi:hypothetical protein